MVLAGEAPVADGAGERLLSRVFPHVARKVGWSVGSVRAQVAGETSPAVDSTSGTVLLVVLVTRFFTRVCSAVHMETSRAFPVFVAFVK